MVLLKLRTSVHQKISLIKWKSNHRVEKDICNTHIQQELISKYIKNCTSKYKKHRWSNKKVGKRFWHSQKRMSKCLINIREGVCCPQSSRKCTLQPSGDTTIQPSNGKNENENTKDWKGRGATRTLTDYCHLY